LYAGASGNTAWAPVSHLPGEVPATSQLLLDILKISGLENEFELKEANVSNLEASISHGKKYIYFNPDYINWLNNITKDKWATLTLLAHEIGHHIFGHTKRRSGSKPKLELQADEFAGNILYQLGATLEETQEVMYHIAKVKRSRTHPSRSSRLDALEKGWSKAAGFTEVK
jgi:Zn-dependent peptidase ImmA (M78 family)